MRYCTPGHVRVLQLIGSVASTKTILPFLLVCLTGTPTLALGQQTTGLEGDWERVFMRLVLPDTTIEETYEPGARSIKILTATRFAFGQQSRDGATVYAGGGAYTLAGDTYIEVIDFHASASLVGRTIPYKTRREGNLWYISGVIGQYRLEETWRRIP